MIKSESKEIDGHIYEVTQLTARRALRAKSKLFKLFGPSITKVLALLAEEQAEAKKLRRQMEIQGYNEDEIQLEESLRASASTGLASVANQLTQNLDEDLLDNLLCDLLAGLRRDNVEMRMDQIDVTFGGNLLTLYKILFFAIEVNFLDFLPQGGIGHLLDGFKPQANTREI